MHHKGGKKVKRKSYLWIILFLLCLGACVSGGTYTQAKNVGATDKATGAVQFQVKKKDGPSTAQKPVPIKQQQASGKGRLPQTGEGQQSGLLATMGIILISIIGYWKFNKKS